MGGKIDKLLCHALKLYFLLEYHMFTIGRRMEAPCNFQGKKTKTKKKKNKHTISLSQDYAIVHLAGFTYLDRC